MDLTGRMELGVVVGRATAVLLRNLKHRRVGTDAVNDARVQRPVSAELQTKLERRPVPPLSPGATRSPSRTAVRAERAEKRRAASSPSPCHQQGCCPRAGGGCGCVGGSRGSPVVKVNIPDGSRNATSRLSLPGGPRACPKALPSRAPAVSQLTSSRGKVGMPLAAPPEAQGAREARPEAPPFCRLRCRCCPTSAPAGR